MFSSQDSKVYAAKHVSMVNLQTHIAPMGLVGVFDLLIYQKNQLDAGKYTVGPVDPMGNTIYKHNMTDICKPVCSPSPTKPFFRPSKISFLFCQETLPSTMCLYQCLHTLLDLSYAAHHDIHRPVLLIKVEQAKQKCTPIYVGLPNTKHWFTVDLVQVISHFLAYSPFFFNFHLDLLAMLGKK